MNIYEIDSAMAALMEAQERGAEEAVDEDGEILPIEVLIDRLAMSRNEKIENAACLLKNYRAEADALKAEEKALSDRRKAAERQVGRLQDYLRFALNGEKFSSARAAVSFRTSASVSVFDSDALPTEYRRIIPETYEADKKAISAAIKAGRDVPGARIEYTQSVTVK